MKKEGICALCGNHAKFVKSHVIPEWAYGALYDEKHRFLKIVPNRRNPVGYARSGEWDWFLCHRCETALSTYDEYARAVIYSKPGETTFGIETQLAPYGADILHIDYARMKLFQLSVLWRAAVCSREFFNEVKIGDHETIIRGMICQKDPGDATEYGCVTGALTYEPRKLFHGFVDKPFMLHRDSWKLVIFLFSGCVWMFVLDQDAHRFPLRKFFLTPGAPMPLHIGSLEMIPGLLEHLQEMGSVFLRADSGGSTS